MDGAFGRRSLPHGPMQIEQHQRATMLLHNRWPWLEPLKRPPPSLPTSSLPGLLDIIFSGSWAVLALTAGSGFAAVDMCSAAWAGFYIFGADLGGASCCQLLEYPQSLPLRDSQHTHTYALRIPNSLRLSRRPLDKRAFPPTAPTRFLHRTHTHTPHRLLLRLRQPQRPLRRLRPLHRARLPAVSPDLCQHGPRGPRPEGRSGPDVAWRQGAEDPHA